MGDTRPTNKTTVGDSNTRRFVQLGRELPSTRAGRSVDHHKKSNYRNCARLCNAISVALLCSTPVYANTTISSPSSSSQGTVINNGYQTINGNFPTHRFSNGIQCQLPTLAFTPFVTKGEGYNTPRITTSRTNIYDTATDSDTGQLLNPGSILYVAEQERIDQTNHNLSYGATISLQVPLGKRFNNECLKAAQAYRKTQEFMLEAKRLEVNLNRAKVCATMLKEGIKFVGDDAISCRNIVLTTIPNQILPHTHEIKKPPNNPEKGG